MGVFISYSHTDVNDVSTIVKILKEHSNQEVWYDHELRGGDQYFSVIAEQILKNEFFIFVVSQSSINSDWCIRELQFAMSEGKRIIAIWLENINIPPGVKLIIQNTHYVNFDRANEAALVQSIERCFAKNPLPTNSSGNDDEEKTTNINEKYFVVKKDVEKIKSLLSCESKCKYSECFKAENAVLLGLAYELGINTEKDNVKALFYYKVGMFKGSEDARFLYAAMLIGEAENPTEHIAEMKKAADAGSVFAMTYYGDICYNGDYGVEKNIDEATKMWIKAAELGSPVSQYYIAYSYRWGECVEKDAGIALMYALSSMEHEFPRAYRIIGLIYENGEFVPQNLKKAQYFYENAINRGDYLSLCYLGGIFYYDYKNYDESIKLYSKAVEYADKGAIKSGLPYYRMAISLEYGRGIEKDIKKAAEFYFKAVERGHKNAKKYIVDVLKEAYCGEELLQMLEKASEYDCKRAEYSIAQILKYRNCDDALKYFAKGAEKGDPYCMTTLIDYYSFVLGKHKEYENRELALKYYELLFSLSGTEELEKHLENLLDTYYYGYACELANDKEKPDKPLALYYFKKSIDDSTRYVHNIIYFAIEGMLFPERSKSGLEQDVVYCMDILKISENAFIEQLDENNPTEKDIDTLNRLTDAYVYFAECYKKGNKLPKDREKSEECRTKAQDYIRLKNKSANK